MSINVRRPPSQRQLQVAEEVRRILTKTINGDVCRDPDLYDINVTVTEVTISPDLSYAKAYVLPLGGKNTDKIVKALNRASGMFKAILAKEMPIKMIPSVHFFADDTFDYAEKINTIIHQTK